MHTLTIFVAYYPGGGVFPYKKDGVLVGNFERTPKGPKPHVLL